MKKAFYIALFSLISMTYFTSCTEDEIKPNSSPVATEGKESDPK